MKIILALVLLAQKRELGLLPSEVKYMSSVVEFEYNNSYILGPLLSLKALIVKYMPPWKPDHIIHIGVEPIFTEANTLNSKRLNILGAPDGVDATLRHLLYLQWCTVNATNDSTEIEAQCDDFEQDNDHVTAVAKASIRKGFIHTLSDAMVYSPRMCQTKWIGDLDI